MEGLNGGNGYHWLPLTHADHEAADRSAQGAPSGEIIDTAVAEFTAQACTLNVAPPFGGFVKVTVPERTVYGVVYAIHTGSLEPGGRAVLRGRDGMRDKAIFDQNPDLEQLLRTEFSALIVGHQEGDALRAYLPPSPPPLHWSVVECDPSEIAKLTGRLDYLRTILSSLQTPVDALLAANIRLASTAHRDARGFRIKAGRELATLLKNDYPRLTAILRALAD
ncbi:MAG: hypothetical protein IT306_25320 [Chloroflexi bacterium]|nr:hypothetical protein [Chloroflexota bacterium]